MRSRSQSRCIDDRGTKKWLNHLRRLVNAKILAKCIKKNRWEVCIAKLAKKSNSHHIKEWEEAVIFHSFIVACSDIPHKKRYHT